MGEQLIDGQNIRSCEKKNIKSCGAKQKPLLCFCLAGPYCIWHTQCLLKKKKKKFLDSRQIYAALLHVSRPDCTLYQGGTETHKHVQAQYVLSGMLWITSRHQYECFFLGGGRNNVCYLVVHKECWQKEMADSSANKQKNLYRDFLERKCAVKKKKKKLGTHARTFKV